ncbi:hypothetical protein REPUB_Repub14bG0061900 [Reevesia pubescens]
MLEDLGKTPETINPSQSVMFKPKPLTASKVFKTLLVIAKESGRKNKKKKLDWIKALVIAAGGGCQDCQTRCCYCCRVEIYTRNLEPSTEKFLDVVIAVTRLKKYFVKSFVLDCEIVAYDRKKQEILPFQLLGTRRRKNVVVNDIKVQVCMFAFDMLDLNGHYEPSMYSSNWPKLKKDYMEGIEDSLDLLPITAYNGRGKSTGVYGAFLLACYDISNAGFQSICKLGTVSSRLHSKVIPQSKPYYRYVADKVKPDV